MKIHRDRRGDAVRAAKDSPPLRGRPEKPAGYVGRLDRAAWPGLHRPPCQPASPADHGHLRWWVQAPVMRVLPLALLVSLAGCVGQVADYVGSRPGIVSPQLIRYGLNLEQTRCVGERLGGALNPRQLRLFARAAGTVQHGYFEPARLTMRDLAWVATSMDDADVAFALDGANAACGVTIATREAPPPVSVPAPAAPRPPAWLNLGAAGSGQSIAIDASTIEQDGSQRSAWFRLTDPGATGPGADVFLLGIDCARRTINPRARRREGAAGAAADRVDYQDNPLAVEGGTVMEIAFLSLCT